MSSERRSLRTLTEMKRAGARIAMVTAYDAPSARLADAAGVDVILVGDSAAMVVLGHESTLPVTLDEMLLLTRAVTRTSPSALVIGDLPFGSYQESDEAAVAAAVRMLKEGRADGVKVEGTTARLSRVRAMVDAGIPVMGHVGLTPQSATLLGGYRMQGRTAAAARDIYEDARALEVAGCFAVVLEAIPDVLAARITATLSVPTIGIGAGPSCDGQVLVWHDLLGLSPDPLPRFVKRYALLNGEIANALRAYVDDVRRGRYPDDAHAYRMPGEERARLEEALSSPDAADG